MATANDKKKEKIFNEKPKTKKANYSFGRINVKQFLQKAPTIPRPRAPYRKYHGVSSCGASCGPAINPVNFCANDYRKAKTKKNRF